MSESIKSPFLVFEQFISPAKCEKLIAELGINTPSLNEAEKPLKHERILRDGEHALLLKGLMEAQKDRIERRYEGTYTGIEAPVFQQYFENAADPCEVHGCENAKYLRKKWVKYKDVDLVGFLWLKDFNNGVPLDPAFEVYGGKLEFPAYNFSLVPQRGTLVLYPAGPHFITAISPILVGSLSQIKISVKLKSNDGLWLYNPQNFPGTYQEWFEQER